MPFQCQFTLYSCFFLLLFPQFSQSTAPYFFKTLKTSLYNLVIWEIFNHVSGEVIGHWYQKRERKESVVLYVQLRVVLPPSKAMRTLCGWSTVSCDLHSGNREKPFDNCRLLILQTETWNLIKHNLPEKHTENRSNSHSQWAMMVQW